MSNIFIFEDNENMPVSKLLSIRGSVYFSCGSRGLGRKLDSLYNGQDAIIIFFDFVPNNINTHNLYLQLLSHIYESGYVSVYIVPILCIEYYVLKMLIECYAFKVGKEYNDLLECLIKNFKWENVPEEKKLISIEVLLKRVLNNSIKRCMRNESGVGGQFYTTDSINCNILNSNYPRCKDACGSLYKKFYNLYTSLPIFDDELLCESVENDNYNDAGIDVVLNKMDEFYYIIFQNMGLEKTICFTDQL